MRLATKSTKVARGKNTNPAPKEAEIVVDPGLKTKLQ